MIVRNIIYQKLFNLRVKIHQLFHALDEVWIHDLNYAVITFINDPCNFDDWLHV